VALCSAALCAPAAALAAEPSAHALLERHAPELRYDSRERDFAVPLGTIFSESATRLIAADRKRLPSDRLGLDALGRTYILDGRPDSAARSDDSLDLPDTSSVERPSAAAPAYARSVLDGRRRLWLQYWFYYVANTQDRGVVRIGRHEGDWELMQVRLDEAQRPVEVTMAQHSAGERCPWSRVERSDGGNAPIVYVAEGSHAAFFSAGTRRRALYEPRDRADGGGPRARPVVQFISDAFPRWMTWPGRWGGSLGGPAPGAQASPRGPAFQGLSKWTDPGEFSERHARTCGACAFATCGRLGAAPFLLWPGAPALGLVALSSIGLGRRWRKRRFSSVPP